MVEIFKIYDRISAKDWTFYKIRMYIGKVKNEGKEERIALLGSTN